MKGRIERLDAFLAEKARQLAEGGGRLAGPGPGPDTPVTSEGTDTMSAVLPATRGRLPDGRIDDEQLVDLDVKVAADCDHCHVVMDFGTTAVPWIAMSPTQAVDLADRLVRLALDCYDRKRLSRSSAG
jgi:hypothetical protein